MKRFRITLVVNLNVHAPAGDEENKTKEFTILCDEDAERALICSVGCKIMRVDIEQLPEDRGEVIWS